MAGRRRLFHRRHGLLAMGAVVAPPRVDKAELPSVKRWFDAMSARPGVQMGMELLADKRGSRR